VWWCRKGKLLSDDPEEEAKQRTFTSLINKLTIDNFNKIVQRMGEIDVIDAKTLKGFVAKIFNKALTESIFCEMYASLCKELLRIMPRFVTPNQGTTECLSFYELCVQDSAEAMQQSLQSPFLVQKEFVSVSM
jgi:MIF4G domain